MLLQELLRLRNALSHREVLQSLAVPFVQTLVVLPRVPQYVFVTLPHQGF